MTLYLSTDGVDDNLVAPSMSYNEVIIDFSATYRADDYIFDNPISDSFLMTYWTSATNKMQTLNYSSYYVNGIQKTTEDMGILSDQRNTVRVISPSTITGLSYIFSTRRGSHPTKGKIYSIKFLNGGVLQAHYDMTTGTVQDQSGNGRHATLNGGTWLDDGAGGGTPIAITSVVANTNANAVVPVVTTQKQVSVSSVITGTAADTFAPTISTVSSISTSVDTITATLSADAINPSLSTENIITSIVSGGVADAMNPSLDATRNIGINSIITDSTADTLAPFVGSSQFVQVAAVITSLTADVIAPSVFTSQGSRIDSVISDMVAEAISPAIQTDVIVSAIITELQAVGIAPTLSQNWTEYREIIQITLNITRKQSASLEIASRKQTEQLEIAQRKQSELKM